MVHKVLSSAHLPLDVRPHLGSALLKAPPSGDMSRVELLRELRDTDGLIALLNVRVDRELLDCAPKLKVVANFAVGYDNIDLGEATRRGVLVTNTPDVLTEATADFAFALLLAAARRLGEGERLARSGEWTGWAPGQLLGGDVYGGTLGVIGAGRIGQAVLRRGKGFGMGLLYASPRPSPGAEKLGARHVELDELLRTSDFISLHCPLNERTANLINAERLALMKKSAVVVNTARGGCVDNDALARALNEGRLGGAGIDVFPNEPAIPKSLLQTERAVLAPHIASATWTARSAMARTCAIAVRSVFDGSCPPTALNPEVMQ